MCDFKKGFKLCTCELDEDSIEEFNYIWRLERTTSNELGIEGMYLPPTNDIGNGLNEEFVLKNLTQRNCFDFEYSPIEGDNLEMRSKINSSYLSFVFTNGSWIIDHPNPFDYEVEEIHSGKIEEIK